MSTKDFKAEVLKNPNDVDLNFKLIVIGNSGVGKSCLTVKATKGRFDSIYSPTISFDFRNLYVKVEDTIIQLQIWDTCGQEVYRSLIRSFYNNSSLAILVYAIDDEMSFNDLNLWLNELKTTGNPDVNIFLIGNKADLEENRKISKNQGQQFAEINKVKLFFETSAKTGFNVQNIFVEASKFLYEKHLKYKNNLSSPESFKSSNSESNNVDLESVSEENDEENNIKRRKCC